MIMRSMLPPCGQCGAHISAGAYFCGACGAAAPEPVENTAAVERYTAVLERFLADGSLEAMELEQLEALRQRLALSLRTHERLLSDRLPAALARSGAGAAPARLRIYVDVSTILFFEVNARCVLRLQVHNDGELALDTVEVHAEVLAGERLDAAVGPAVFPGQAGVVPVWLVPRVAGFHELRGVLHVTDLAGARSFFRFEGLQFRVGAAGEARVSVVNIDQRSARVVDNSHAQFTRGEERGGLVGDGDWRPVPLRPLGPSELRQHAALARFMPSSSAVVPSRTASALTSARISAGGPVSFTVYGERGSYAADTRLAQGDLSTVYSGRRLEDGAAIVVKLVDDKLDNDLMQAEIGALGLLRAEDSPQHKHLPVVLDRFAAPDGRMGTVFERIDGLDLITIRERLPAGIPPRHIIWLMRRCLSALGWAHSHGVLHGNLDPAHILVRPRDHNVWIVDWCYAIVNPARTGQSFKALNEIYSPPEVAARKPPLPSSDLYALGKCMFYAAGGDPAAKTLPAHLDERLQRFLQFFVLESPLGRAQDAWQGHAQLDRIREDIWGAHTFEVFEV